MQGRILFVTGAAVGYVLGARAGRRRYDQIKSAADRVWNDRNVQKSVNDVVGTVQGFVKDKAPEVQDAVVDLSTMTDDRSDRRTAFAFGSSGASDVRRERKSVFALIGELPGLISTLIRDEIEQIKRAAISRL